MDVYFYHDSVTDIPLYNCSETELMSMNATQRPLRGISSFCAGLSMILVYIVCLRAIVNLALTQSTCYKLMFVIGVYEILIILISDFFISFSLTFGLTVCDAPNTFYTMGCLIVFCFAGVSYFCLYLSFNRMLEVLQFRRKVIDFFFSTKRTNFGILIGISYSFFLMLFTTPPVYSNEAGTPVPNPLGFKVVSNLGIRNGLLIANNCGVFGLTCIFYGIFLMILRQKYKKLSLPNSLNSSQKQVFIQSTLMSVCNFTLSSAYAVFLILGDLIVLPRIGFMVYQFTAGLQALIYLLFNQTILNEVKSDMSRYWPVERKNMLDATANRSKTNTAVLPGSNIITDLEIR